MHLCISFCYLTHVHLRLIIQSHYASHLYTINVLCPFLGVKLHYINIHNKSNHDQEFEVHGWNNNRNIVVKPHATVVLPAADKSSGAIIALHDGHEGEQAEITKDGYMSRKPSKPKLCVF